MKFIVENEAFAKALSQVKGCIPPRSTIPILAHVAVEAKAGNVVTVRATNLEREAEIDLPAEVAAAGGAALPGEILVNLAKRLPKGGQTEIALDGERVKIGAGQSKYDLRTLPLADFPTAKAIGDTKVEFAIGVDALRQLIQRTNYALAVKGIKPYHDGIYLHAQGQRLLAVASDDHRLALHAVDLPKGAASMPGVVVPSEAARQIAGFLDETQADVVLSVSPSILEVRIGGLRFATALIDCTFPPYERVIPKPNGVAATFRPYALAEAVSRAIVVYLGEMDINRKSPVIKVDTKNGAINLEAGIRGNEQAAEVVEAETNGRDLSFVVHAGYLADMLGVWPDTAALGMQQKDPSSPILFMVDGQPNDIHLIMPTRR